MLDVATAVYFVKPDDFHAILNDFEDFDFFVRTRAIRRRAFVRHLESQVVAEIQRTDSSYLEISSEIDDYLSNTT